MLRMSVSFTFKVDGDDLEKLDSHIDDVMEQLIKVGAMDPTVMASLASREVEVSVDVRAKKHTLALPKAFVVIKRAIEAAGGRVVDSLGDPIESPSEPALTTWDRHAVGVAA